MVFLVDILFPNQLLALFMLSCLLIFKIFSYKLEATLIIYYQQRLKQFYSKQNLVLTISAVQLKAISTAKGSCYIENGNTKVICAVSSEVPKVNKYA